MISRKKTKDIRVFFLQSRQPTERNLALVCFQGTARFLALRPRAFGRRVVVRRLTDSSE